jgi:hypothetical protein
MEEEQQQHLLSSTWTQPCIHKAQATSTRFL